MTHPQPTGGTMISRLLLAVSLLSGCTGMVADKPATGDGDGDSAPEPPSLDDSSGELSKPDIERCRVDPPDEGGWFATVPALKRLAIDQYQSALRDLSGDPEAPIVSHPDPAPAGNALSPAELRVGRQMVEDVEANAWALASRLESRLVERVGCRANEDDACLDPTLDRLALWFLRRPLDDDHRAHYHELFSSLREIDPSLAVTGLIAAFAQAPGFLYVWDAAKGPSARDDAVALDDWQRAEALALFLWRSLPDEALLERAAQGELADVEVFSAEVARMLDDPRARRNTDRFVDQWLMLSGLNAKSKQEPEWSPALASAFRADTEHVFAELMLRGDAHFADLFKHDTAWVTKTTAPLLGAAMNEEDGRFMALAPHRRMGLLTHNSFLAAHSRVDGSSPIQRGHVFNKQILCQTIASPPDDVEIPPESELVAGATAREALAEHRENPICAGCHRFIDPPGLALENWDGLGRYRETEDGAAIDPAGALTLEDDTVAFATPAELFDVVATSGQAQSCFVSRWLHQALAKPLAASGELCARENLTAAFTAGGDSLRATLERIALHPSFSLRQEVESP